MPSEAVLDLFEIDVPAVEHYFADDPAVSVCFVGLDRDGFAEYQAGKILL